MTKLCSISFLIRPVKQVKPTLCSPSISMQSNLTVIQPLPGGWVGLGGADKQDNLVLPNLHPYILQTQIIASCTCCIVNSETIFVARSFYRSFYPHSTQYQNVVCLHVMVFVTLCMTGWAYLWACLSDVAIIPQIWWLARFCPGQASFLHIYILQQQVQGS